MTIKELINKLAILDPNANIAVMRFGNVIDVEFYLDEGAIIRTDSDEMEDDE